MKCASSNPRYTLMDRIIANKAPGGIKAPDQALLILRLATLPLPSPPSLLPHFQYDDEEEE